MLIFASIASSLSGLVGLCLHVVDLWGWDWTTGRQTGKSEVLFFGEKCVPEFSGNFQNEQFCTLITHHNSSKMPKRVAAKAG